MKLKTLKDLRFADEGILVHADMLREEAINWANDKESYEKFDHKENYWRWVFMNFHNITEEDLK